MRPMRAKVCGLTRAEDAKLALSCGADWLGFVHCAESPRHCVELEALAPLAGGRGVLVIVSDDVDQTLQLLRITSLARVQPYFSEGVRTEGVRRLRAAGYEVFLPWPDIEGQAKVAADLYIWETPRAQTGVHGGSGQAHAAVFPPPGPFLLAGGIDAETIRSRLNALSPDLLKNLRGFDASSRLESSPGVKDADRLRHFVNQVHAHAV